MHVSVCDDGMCWYPGGKDKAVTGRNLSVYHIAGAKEKDCRSYGICAGIALGMMMIGALGTNLVPKEYFGIVERFSVFAATGYNAVLGIELYRMKFLDND